ncbi:MAG: hypothetical protein ACRELD_10100 [Longimicrobiales bacterium]
MDQEELKRRARATAVRETDLEPYTALRWVGTIFKAAAVFLLIAIIGEIVAGLRIEGTGALPILLGELARTLVLAVVLWGGGDVARLIVDVGHDIRAQRIMLARIGYRLRHGQAPPEGMVSTEEADAFEQEEERQAMDTEEPGALPAQRR